MLGKLQGSSRETQLIPVARAVLEDPRSSLHFFTSKMEFKRLCDDLQEKKNRKRDLDKVPEDIVQARQDL